MQANSPGFFILLLLAARVRLPSSSAATPQPLLRSQPLNSQDCFWPPTLKAALLCSAGTGPTVGLNTDCVTLFHEEIMFCFLISTDVVGDFYVIMLRHWRRERQPTPAFLPAERGHRESETTAQHQRSSTGD